MIDIVRHCCSSKIIGYVRSPAMIIEKACCEEDEDEVRVDSPFGAEPSETDW